MIDIIIPAYNSHKTISQTLFSIAIQENVKDLNVYIVNDFSKTDYQNEVKFFSKFMNISELKLKENKGPGYARQYGIDNSNGEYIVFIDGDDVFYDCYSLSNLYNAIISDDYDVVVSNFVEEKENYIALHQGESIYVHGKIYKRRFLIENKIRFNDSRHDEDNGFNQLLFFHNPKVFYSSDKTLVWRNNQESITRKGVDKFASFGLSGYVYNIKWAIEEGIKSNCDRNKMSSLAFSSLLSLYYYYLSLNDDNIFKIVKPLLDLYLTIPVAEEEKENLIENQFNFSINICSKHAMLNPKITFYQFLDEVSKVGDNK